MGKQGGIADGWRKRGIQLPHGLDARFSSEVELRSYNAVKLIGSAAIAMFMGLPSDVRREVFTDLLELHAEGPDAITPERVWYSVWRALHSSAYERGIEHKFDTWIGEVTTGEVAEDEHPVLSHQERVRLSVERERRLRSDIDSGDAPR